MDEDKIQIRQKKEKAQIIERLKKVPIIQSACNSVGVGRTTYYRWIREDPEFSRNVEEAMLEGTSFVSDISEGQLLKAINEGNLSAVFYWLNNRHNAYGNKVNTTRMNHDEMKELLSLLNSSETFKKGHELLMSYVLQGKINEKNAELILKLHVYSLKSDEISVRKIEAEILGEVLLRKRTGKLRKK